MRTTVWAALVGTSFIGSELTRSQQIVVDVVWGMLTLFGAIMLVTLARIVHAGYVRRRTPLEVALAEPPVIHGPEPRAVDPILTIIREMDDSGPVPYHVPMPRPFSPSDMPPARIILAPRPRRAADDVTDWSGVDMGEAGPAPSLLVARPADGAPVTPPVPAPSPAEAVVEAAAPSAPAIEAAQAPIDSATLSAPDLEDSVGGSPAVQPPVDPPMTESEFETLVRALNPPVEPLALQEPIVAHPALVPPVAAPVRPVAAPVLPAALPMPSEPARRGVAAILVDEYERFDDHSRVLLLGLPLASDLSLSLSATFAGLTPESAGAGLRVSLWIESAGERWTTVAGSDALRSAPLILLVDDRSRFLAPLSDDGTVVTLGYAELGLAVGGAMLEIKFGRRVFALTGPALQSLHDAWVRMGDGARRLRVPCSTYTPGSTAL